MSARSAYGLEVAPDRTIRWEEQAACKMGGRLGDPDAWFIASKLQWLADKGNRTALYICQNECPVRAACREAAYVLREQYPLASEIRGGQWFDAGGRAHDHAGSGRIR